MVVLKKGLSIVVNTKNEEFHIEECLNSVKGWADEIIVVDMSSTDKTVEIAQKLGAIIYSTPDIGWVEPIRNWSFDKASYEWVFSLDADERIPKTLRNKIDEIITADNWDVVKIPWKNIFFNKWIQHTLWWPDHHPRLFRKGYVKLEKRIHPEATCKGRVLELEAKEEWAVVHNNAENINVWMKKIDIYTSRENFFDKQNNFTPRQLISRFDNEFVERYFNSKGYLDGIHGYILSKFMEFYRFLEFAKYWERREYGELFKKNSLKKACEIKYDTSEESRVLREEVEDLKATLTIITSSKIYKIWKYYTDIKKKLINIFNRQQ